MCVLNIYVLFLIQNIKMCVKNIYMLQFVKCPAAQRKSAGCFDNWVGLHTVRVPAARLSGILKWHVYIAVRVHIYTYKCMYLYASVGGCSRTGDSCVAGNVSHLDILGLFLCESFFVC